MALNYPTSTQWITFPVDLKDVKKITWSEGKSSKSATYYTRKGYWGDIANPKSLEDASKPRAEENGWESLDIKGHAQLFIASEFIDPSLRGGPMKNYHVKSIAKFAPTEPDTQWATMQLNKFFHYGQSGSKGNYKRWVVYHPPISNVFSSPRPYQHRFMGLLSADIAEAIAQDLPGLAAHHSETAKKAAKWASALLKLGANALKNVIGHHLHQFLDEKDVKDVQVKFKQPNDKPADAAKTRELKAKELLALQKLEAQNASEENKITDEGIHARALEALDDVQHSRETADMEQVLIERFIFPELLDDGPPFDEIVEVVADVLNDDADKVIQDDLASLTNDPQAPALPHSKSDISQPSGSTEGPASQSVLGQRDGVEIESQEPKYQSLMSNPRENTWHKRPLDFKSAGALQVYKKVYGPNPATVQQKKSGDLGQSQRQQAFWSIKQPDKPVDGKGEKRLHFRNGVIYKQAPGISTGNPRPKLVNEQANSDAQKAQPGKFYLPPLDLKDPTNRQINHFTSTK